MDTKLAGKTALVTGGTRGIGRAIAERLLREKVRVAICGTTQEGVARAVKEMSASPGGEIAGWKADVSRIADVETLFRNLDERFGVLDILVNNAGVGAFRPLPELTPEDWHRMIDLNLNGVFYCSREAAPRLKKQGSGYIVNISSLAGKNPLPGGAAYNATKFGLNGFSEASMLDLRQDNIRVSYIMPGSVATDFIGQKGAGKVDWKIAPEDIADVVAMLLSMPQRTLVSRVEIRPSKPPK
jgi:3-oxoacyl-[acyl-carrier protein] reductase